jgi:putative effector of murein hydrolase LrgA (UPF0299 family)
MCITRIDYVTRIQDEFNKVMAVMVVSSALVLSGCSAMGTAIKKRNLGKNPDERNNLAGTFK